MLKIHLFFIAEYIRLYISFPFEGAVTIRPGIERINAISKTPWCVGPSFPTKPPLSIQNIAGSFCKAKSWMILSYALCINVEYIGIIGIVPAADNPAEYVTAWPSAITTSIYLSGYLSVYSDNPVPIYIAAVTHIKSFVFAKLNKVFPKTEENENKLLFLTGFFIPDKL